MKRLALFSLTVFFLFCVPLTAHTAQPVQVEILYMNHGPLIPTITEIKNICTRFGNKVNVAWYDFDSQAGENFMAKKGIRQHVPLMIWIDGKSTVKLNGREINFSGFPTGSGPASFQGKWATDDLRKVLDQLTRNR
jgi:hypothetical protein